MKIERGASIGAAAVVVGGVRVGSWAMVGAGAVVARDVPVSRSWSVCRPDRSAGSEGMDAN